jgi:DNA-binding LytR/AlgR family response regulator
MKVLIIEDEAPAVRKLRGLLNNQDVDIEVLADIDTVEEAVEWLSNNPSPDVIFSDIQLADGVSFEIYSKVPPKCPIIFTTAYDEYALKAFELNSLDYLLKPYTEEQFNRAFQKIKTTSTNANEVDKIKSVLAQLNIKSNQYKERFLVSKAGVLLPIKVDDVAYFYTEDKTINLVTKTKERYFISSSLDELEVILNPSNFYRVNRQYIVNANAIVKIENFFNGKLVIQLIPTAPHEVVVSRARATSFKNWMDS